MAGSFNNPNESRSNGVELAFDPNREITNLAEQDVGRVQKMSTAWEQWAESDMVKPKSSSNSPQLINKAFTITADVTPAARNGVILAQGGDQRGYSLHLKDGKPIFSVRQDGKLYTAAAPQGKFAREARLEKDGAMTLAIDGKIVARGKAPGVFTVQPKDELSIGEDVLSAVGDYTAPHALKGKIENVKIATR